MAASSQFPSLSRLFELQCLAIPLDDRTTLDGLVSFLVEHVHAEHAARPGRPTWLFGESLGGVVALAVALAARRGAVSQLVLVNPATSFNGSAWPSLAPLLLAVPEGLYNGLPYVLAPILGDPLKLAAAALAVAATAAAAAPREQTPLEAAAGVASALAASVSRLSILADVLPPATLAHRLTLLADGCAAVNPHLGRVRVPTLVVVGDADRLIPSATEGPRLAAAIAGARLHSVPGGSHALLQEGTELSGLFRELGLYAGAAEQARKLFKARADAGAAAAAAAAAAEAAIVDGGHATSAHHAGAAHAPPPPHAAAAASAPAPPPAAAAAPPPRARRPLRPPHSSRGGPSLGAAALPSAEALASARRPIKLLRRLVSPVFISTAPDGVRTPGLSALPAEPEHPLLLVGNHQLFAPDLGILIEEILSRKGVLVRGLAHPAVFTAGAAQSRSDTALDPVTAATAAALLPREPAGGGGTNTLATFGAVPVSGRALLTLLTAGETVLLYPGGVREAYKRKGEPYTLHWPDKPEFVRAASACPHCRIPSLPLPPFSCRSDARVSSQCAPARALSPWPPSARRTGSQSSRMVPSCWPPRFWATRCAPAPAVCPPPARWTRATRARRRATCRPIVL